MENYKPVPGSKILKTLECRQEQKSAGFKNRHCSSN